MFVGISVKNIKRTPGKTFLFAVLIYALTLLLFLCIYTFTETRRMREDAENNYITIGAVELTDSAPYASFDYSLFYNSYDWQPNIRRMGLTEYNVRTNDGGVYKNMAVLVVGNLFFDSHINAFIGTVYKPLSSYHSIEKTMILLFPGTSGFAPETGRKYVIHCEYIKSPNAFKAVSVCSGGIFTGAVPFLPLDDADAFINAGIGDFFNAAGFYNNERSKLVICPVRSLESNMLFHQQTVYLSSGRGFLESEYTSDINVCVISEKFANLTGLSVGDKIPLFITDEYNASANNIVYENYIITGLMHTEPDFVNYVFIPVSDLSAKNNFIPLNPGQLLGQVVLENGTGDEFLTSISGKLPENMTVTVYDHGYESIVRVLDSMITITLILGIVAALVCASMLALYGYLFVARQRETAATMVCLGTPKISILIYLLFGSGLIAFAASGAGALTGTLAGPGIFRLVYELFASLSAVDSRFSDTAVGVIPKTNINAGFYLSVSLLVPLAVLALSLIFCFISAFSTFDRKSVGRISKKSVRRTAKLPKPPKKSSLLPPSSLKYSLLSIKRGRMRSFAVPALALVMTVFLSSVAFSADSGKQRIDEIYSETEIRGHITDLSGKLTQGLSVDSGQLESLLLSGYFNNISPTIKDNYMYLGVAKYADGRQAGEIDFIMPSGFGLATFINEFYTNPSAVFTGNLSLTPGFIQHEMSVRWADGYNEVNFVSPQWDGDIPCVVTSSFAYERGVGAGDVIRIIVTGKLNELGLFNIVDAYIAGVCENAAPDSKTIMFPLSNTDLLKNKLSPSDETAVIAGNTLTPDRFLLIFRGRNYSSVYFTLIDTTKINSVKNFLSDSGYSYKGYTGKIRMSVQLEDKQFYENLRPARQQTQYMNLLFPLLFTVSAAVGIAISTLMTGARREEIAIMRGSGTSRKRTFLSFFYESAILAAFGSLTGWLLFLLIIINLNSTVGPRFFLCLPGFLICYLTGSAFSVFTLCRKKITDILRNKE